MHAPSGVKNVYSNDNFYLEIEYVFEHFPNYNLKILFRGFNEKLKREDIFKPTIGNESLHQDCNDNGVRIVNYAKLKSYNR